MAEAMEVSFFASFISLEKTPLSGVFILESALGGDHEVRAK